MKEHQLVFTGAQGTGKTTMLNLFKDKFDVVITEVVRNLSKQGVKVNELGDCEGQKRIFDEYLKLLDNDKSFISDRCLIDVLTYTKYLSRTHKDPEIRRQLKILLGEQRQITRDFFKEHQDIDICFFPAEFEVVDDGFRSTSKEFRDWIDDNIYYELVHLVKNKERIFVIRGSVEERTKQIEKILNL